MPNELPNDNSGRLISLAEAANYMVSTRLLRQLALKGRLQAQKVGKFFRLLRREIWNCIFIAARKWVPYRDDIEILMIDNLRHRSIMPRTK